MDYSPPGPSVHGILQARTLEWVAISYLPQTELQKESEVAQLYPTLFDPVDCSLPGSSIHGIFQARVLEWGAHAFSELCMLTDVNYYGEDYFTVFKNMKSLCCPHEANTILYIKYASLWWLRW